MDWRTHRRSAYNYSAIAAAAYKQLIQTLNARYILTSYSSDGTIPLTEMLSANIDRGDVTIEMKGYKRYRVSSQRYSEKPMNVEFVLVLDTHKKASVTAEELRYKILNAEGSVIKKHSESSAAGQISFKI